ncbi:outer membrane beta-barrel protein [Fibrivirga algicola]|uniref:Porin family protein n=1 Tax=Fibrivirga algicola TaxID=2950420 RepID=A0ABX0QDF5_9BACT|nr:outer membrane beta-barrel protein [Fibrivirga algicola]NID08863.1 porin family protein [Fibrivirga algicola]
MKRLLLVAGFLVPLFGFSQSPSDQKQGELLGQGHLSAGINVGGAFGPISSGDTKYLAPHIQYFLKDGWSIALEGRHNANGNFSRYTGLGLSSRYYFVRDRRLALFGQAGASLGQSKFSGQALEAAIQYLPTTTYNYERSTAWQTSAGLGVHFRIAKRWALEGIGERAWTELTKTLSHQRWQGSVGINFLMK